MYAEERLKSEIIQDAMAKKCDEHNSDILYRLIKILKISGIEMQNGFTPGRGTVGGSCRVRTLLKKRKEHKQEMYGY